MNRQVNFEVRGMHCPDCPGKVERNLLKLEGVEEVTVDYESEHGQVTYNEEQISLPTIFDRISELGFEADVLQEQ